MTEEKIHESLAYHKPDEGQLERIEDIRAAHSKVLALINATAKPGRYRSLAITALEESCMWAVKAVVLENSASSYLDTPGS